MGSQAEPAAPGCAPRDVAPVEARTELTRIRASIDNLDAALVHLLAERFTCTQQIGELKARYGMPAADPAREAEQIARLRRLAHESRLDPEFAEKFLTFIVAEVVRHHERIARS
jgi:chorismate mutase